MTVRPPLGELEAGQPVMVRRSAGHMRGRPVEDRYIPAVVVKAARVWVEIAMSDVDLPTWSLYRWRMRRDTQNEGASYSSGNASFATLDQHSWDEAMDRARGVLAENGINLERDSLWRGREVELADMISKGER